MSSASRWGSSKAAKCPPLGISVHRCTLYDRSPHSRGQLREQGLALGGSMRNAILVSGNEVLNAEGLRFADEFARHKVLDCLGDLALAGAPIFGHLKAYKPGHRLNNALLREVFAHPDAWSRLSYKEVKLRTDWREHSRVRRANLAAQAPD